MSYFYLSPVKGNMAVHLLEIIVMKRLEHLKAIYHGESTVYSEYVVEGSLYDNVGHFMLCLITILSKEIGVSKFILQAEVLLFERRLKSQSPYDTRCFAIKILKNVKRYGYNAWLIQPVLILCQHLKLKHLAQHVCSPNHRNDCAEHKIELNYQYCLDFLSKRQVELNKGIAYLPCGKWIEYMIMCFRLLLEYKMKKIDLPALQNDIRIKKLVKKARKKLAVFIKKNEFVETLSSESVDGKSKLFPPCMLNLHHNLRIKHRLSHSQRFYYSLFLKDIGMPVEEAIHFWKLEYAQDPNNSHCHHNWAKDEKKYTYGIKHMYGLEGGRKNYTSVSCQKIQSIESACTEGGCPFKSFDEPNMVQLLEDCPDSVLTKIKELKSQHQYKEACMSYLQRNYVKKLYEADNLDLRINFNPLKYYMTAKSYQE